MDEELGFCPLALTSEVIGDRWTPLILRELILGNTRFNDIARGLPGISRSLLVQRLKHLQRKGVVQTVPLPAGRGNAYQLTPAGRDLFQVLYLMGRWSVTWLCDRLDPAAVEAEPLMWWMHRRVDATALPPQRVTVQFDHTAPERKTFWMVFEGGAATVCLADPGFPVDALVSCATEQLGRVFAGFQTWADALRSGRIEVRGRREVTRALPTWFVWSPWSADVRQRSLAQPAG